MTTATVAAGVGRKVMGLESERLAATILDCLNDGMNQVVVKVKRSRPPVVTISSSTSPDEVQVFRPASLFSGGEMQTCLEWALDTIWWLHCDDRKNLAMVDGPFDTYGSVLWVEIIKLVDEPLDYERVSSPVHHVDGV